jgi:hypothetical protein
MSVRVRRIEARDEVGWRELWDQYTRFYEREPRQAITRQTWERILDARWPIHAIVAGLAAEFEDEGADTHSERRVKVREIG